MRKADDTRHAPYQFRNDQEWNNTTPRSNSKQLLNSLNDYGVNQIPILVHNDP
jgi:hypothetical protein